MECEAEETVEDRASADEQRVGGGGKVGRMLIGVGHMWMGWLPAVLSSKIELVLMSRVGGGGRVGRMRISEIDDQFHHPPSFP